MSNFKSVTRPNGRISWLNLDEVEFMELNEEDSDSSITAVLKSGKSVTILTTMTQDEFKNLFTVMKI